MSWLGAGPRGQNIMDSSHVIIVTVDCIMPVNK